MVKQKGGLILSVHVGLIIWPFWCAGFEWESGFVFFPATCVTFNTTLGYAPKLNGLAWGQRRHHLLSHTITARLVLHARDCDLRDGFEASFLSLCSVEVVCLKVESGESRV